MQKGVGGVPTETATVNWLEADEWAVAEAVIGVADKVLLYGPPGTGKTTVAATHNLGGRKVFSVTMTEEKSASELVGHLTPVGDVFEWMDAPGAASWRVDPGTGLAGRLVINEIDHAAGDALDVLHVLCDDPAIASLTLPKHDLETIRPGKGFQVVATMNGTPDSLPEAVRDRFPVAIPLNSVRPSALAALDEDLRRPAATTSTIGDSRRRIGIRAWFAFQHLRREVGPDLAGRAVFGAGYRDLLSQWEIAVS